MSTSATYTVNNPTVGQEYVAPSAYWVIPNGGTSVTVTVQAFDGSGNLTVVSSMTAICRNISAGTDAGSYTYNGGNTVNSTSSNGVNGSNVFAPAGKVGSSCAQLRMYISYTGRIYDQPPNAPSNLAPSGTVTTLTPTFTGAFSDPTSGDTLAQYEIVVNNAPGGGGSQIWDSGNVGASSSETSSGVFSRAYGGSALAFGSNYSFKARVANQNGNWGPWSGWVNFSTVQGPNAPSITAPSGLQTTTTPAWGFTYSSPAATAMASYQYQLFNAGGGVIYDSGEVADSVANNASVSGAIPSGYCVYGGSYTFAFRVKDANGAWSGWASGAFSVAALPQVSPSSPTGGATVTTQTPTFAWTYLDPNYPQSQAQLEIQDATTGADLALTGWMSQSATSWTTTTAIAYGTRIRWRVQVTDSAGLASGWSAWASAYVNNAPEAAITSPAAGGSIATVTPTILWTYTPSSGGQVQAAAQVTLADANGNTLATYSVSGTSTSYTVPAGVLNNGQSYQVTVQVTDTNSIAGQSATVTFTVSLVPPADMQGQPLPNGANYLLGPKLNEDAGAGIPVQWSLSSDGGGAYLGSFSLDPTIAHPEALASGDGQEMGAWRLGYRGVGSGTVYWVYLNQTVPVAKTPIVAGTDVVSVSVYYLLSVLSGAPTAQLSLLFKDSSYTQLGYADGALGGDTSGALTRFLGPQNVPVPANTAYIEVELRLHLNDVTGQTDQANLWFCDAQLERASASDAGVISGDMGTGYTYDANGYSMRTLTGGSLPTAVAAPGADTDPASGYGGSVILTWDTSLADPRFMAYLVERRRQDAASDDTAWQLLATLTNAAQGSYTDYTAASQTTYQYAVRQQIQYSSGDVGVSQHRAIVAGSVNFSPAWYLTNAGQAGAPIYNVRLRYVQPKRQLQWQERATYSAFLGRVGAARDAGAPAGYLHTLVCYFSELRGDSRVAIRRQFIAMQRLGGVWYLKDPGGLAVPVFLQNVTFDEEATYSETILTVTLSLQQASDTADY